MAIVNITTTNDADFYRAFAFMDTNSVPISLVGAALRMMLRRHAADITVWLTLTSDSGGGLVITDAANGKFTVLITQAQLEELPTNTFDHSLIMTQNGLQTSIWTGTLTNAPGPSR